jgi:predicted DNA-binding transcriptional regulator AlpA
MPVTEKTGLVARLRQHMQRHVQQHAEQAQQQRRDAEDRPLPRFVRYRHLHEAGIAASWKSLYEMIDKYGFPVGVCLTPNIRAWDVDQVERWLANRPSERKPVPSRWQREGTSTEAI